MAAVLALACVVLLGAEPVGSVEEAKRHFDAGKALFAVGRYQDAAVEFEAGYQLSKRPLLLFNMAQAHRKAAEATDGRAHYQRALEIYRLYLEGALGDDPQRTVAEHHIGAIEVWMAAHPVVLEAPVVSVPQNALAADPTISEPVPAESVWTRHRWVIPVLIGAGVIAAGVGVAVGVRASSGCAQASLGCIDATK